MSPAGPAGRLKPKSDSTALALLIGMVLAVAVTAGASLSAAGSGALQQAFRTMGFGRDSEIQAEQRKQATAIAEIERIISRIDNEIGGLTTRMLQAESNETLTSERLARLGGEVAAATMEMKELRQRGEAAGEAWRKPVDHLNAAVTGARSDIITLRSSLDAYDQTRKGDVSALSKRLDRLEKTLAVRDTTVSAPARGAESAAPGQGVMGILGLRGSTAGEARNGHLIDMGTPTH